MRVVGGTALVCEKCEAEFIVPSNFPLSRLILFNHNLSIAEKKGGTDFFAGNTENPHEHKPDSAVAKAWEKGYTEAEREAGESASFLAAKKEIDSLTEAHKYLNDFYIGAMALLNMLKNTHWRWPSFFRDQISGFVGKYESPQTPVKATLMEED